MPLAQIVCELRMSPK